MQSRLAGLVGGVFF